MDLRNRPALERGRNSFVVSGLALRFLLFLADFFGAAFFRFLAAFFGSDLLSSWGPSQISIDLLYCFLRSIGCYFLGGLLDCLLWCCLSGRSFWGSHPGGSQILEYSPAGSPGSLAATALMAFPGIGELIRRVIRRCDHLSYSFGSSFFSRSLKSRAIWSTDVSHASSSGVQSSSSSTSNLFAIRCSMRKDRVASLSARRLIWSSRWSRRSSVWSIVLWRISTQEVRRTASRARIVASKGNGYSSKAWCVKLRLKTIQQNTNAH